MPKRLQMVADALAKNLEPDHEAVRRKRDLAQDLPSAADEAEQKGCDLQRQVARGMVQ